MQNQSFQKLLQTFLTGILLTAFCAATSAQQRSQLVSETANKAMSGAWESGQLPAPLAVPSGNADEAIAILAQKVAAKTDESIPAFLTALQMSGFFVTKQDGSVFLAPADNKGQGLAINGWEVASSAKMFGDGKAVTAAELNQVLKSIPALKNAEPMTLMMQGVRANAENTQNKFLRSWARFILELGKTETGDKINAIQHLVLFRRLYGDLHVRTLRYHMESGGLSSTEQNKIPRFYGASYSVLDETAFSAETESIQPNNITDQKNIPCKMEGNAPTIMDASATIIGYGYGELMNYLEEVYQNTPTGTTLEKASKMQAIANIILAYAKFIQSYAALETKLTLKDSSRLVRTRDTRPGERRNMTAAVRINIGNWQMYNCIRTALNVTAGIDFATLNDGPIGDVGVTWHLDKGGAKDEYSNSTGINPNGEQIVGFTQDGAIRIQDKGTTTANSPNVSYGKTNAEGISNVILEGSPQKNFKKFKVRPVMKEAIVRTTIKLKAGEIKGDMVDVSGQALGGVAGLISMPTELLYRVSWASSGTLTVPVQDWEDCTGGWSGEISIKIRDKDWSQTPQEKAVIGFSQSTTSRTYEYDGKIIIENAVARRSGATGVFALLRGASNATSKIVWEDSSIHTYRDNCGQTTTTRTLFKSSRREESGTNRDTAEGELAIDLSNNTYRFQIVIPPIPGKTTDTDLRRPTGYCRIQDNEEKTTKSEWSTEIGQMPIEISDGLLDAKNPDLIEGFRAFTNANGAEVEITWFFTNCR